MTPIRISAFSDGITGGNPAGVVLGDALPTPADMQRIAAEVGYSETAFAAPSLNGPGWQVRYYAPEAEVAFCGHATIALAVALGQAHGAGRFALSLKQDNISVDAVQEDGAWSATLTSPKTWSRPLDAELTTRLRALFSLTPEDFDPRLPPTLSFAGEQHAILTLRSRDRVAEMAYDFEDGRALMQAEKLTTITLAYIEDEATFVTRNAFAIGGVVEDAATGAAAAALGGALVDLGWPAVQGGGSLTIRQGEDMGQPSRLSVTVTGTPGDPVQVGGRAHLIQ